MVDENVQAAQTPAPLLPCWCGSGNWKRVFQARRFALVRCTNCGTYQTDPPPVRSEDQSEAFYSHYYEVVGAGARPTDPSAGLRGTHLWKYGAQVPELLRPGRRVVDVGCGDGHLCARLKAHGWLEVIGVDISRSRIERARRLYPYLDLRAGSISNARLETASADMVIMEATVEHLPDPLEVLCEIRPFLTPDGRLVLTTPNLDSGNFRLLGRHWTGMLAPHAHVFLFTAPSLAALLRRAAYRVLAIGSYENARSYRLPDYYRRVRAGDWKGAVWRAYQEVGRLYGLLIGKGPMLFAVATPA